MRASSFPLLVLVLAASPLPAQPASSAEGMAEQIFSSGQKLMRDRYYQQAIQDFTTLLNSYPNSQFADNALLELGRYYYQVEHSSQKALEQFEQIINRFQGRDTTPDAYLFKGVVLVEEATSEQQLQDGLANFLRTVQFYPTSSIVSEALYRAGLVEFRLQHYEQSVEYLTRSASEYPSDAKAPAAQLALGRSFLYLGKLERALSEIQRVRDLYPTRPEAAVALRWATLMWRLYLQPKVEAGSAFRNQELRSVKSAQPMQDCAGMAFDQNQVLYFSDPKNTRVYVLDADLRTTSSVSARKPAGIAFDSRNQLLVADGSGIIVRDAFSPLSFLKGAKREQAPLEKAREVARSSFGDYFVLDSDDGRVLRYNARLGFDSVYPPSAEGGVESLALDPHDRLALLFKRERRINIYDRKGKLVTTIAPQGPGYVMQEPARARFDVFGHLYVLDRDARAVQIFDREGKFAAQISSLQLKAPRELAVNDAGEIFVWDDSLHGLWVMK